MPEPTPAVGRLLGTNSLQAAIDKFSATVDRLGQVVAREKGGAWSSAKGGLSSIWTGKPPSGGWAGKSNGGDKPTFGGQSSPVGTRTAPGSAYSDILLGGGGGGDTPTFSKQGGGGANNGGQRKHYYGAGAIVGGFVAAGLKNMPDQTVRDYNAYSASQLSGMSLTKSGDALTGNLAVGYDAADKAGAASILMQSQGAVVGSATWNSAKSAYGQQALLNPYMSGIQNAQVVEGWQSARTFNSLRGYGINTMNLNNGSSRSTLDIGKQIAARAGIDTSKKLTAQQIAATYKSTDSNLNQSMRLQVQAGNITQSQAEAVSGVLTQRATAMFHGMSGAEFDKTSALAAQGGAVGAAAAKKLDHFKVGGTVLASQQRAVGSQEDVQNQYLQGFSDAVHTANGFLSQFNRILKDIVTGPIGKAVGYTQGGAASIAGAVGSNGASIAAGMGAHTLAKRAIAKIATRSVVGAAEDAAVVAAEGAGLGALGAAALPVAVGAAGLSAAAYGAYKGYNWLNKKSKKGGPDNQHKYLTNPIRKFLKSMGGHFSDGGKVPGNHNRDDVPIFATPGEVVVPKPTVAAHGGPESLMKLLGFDGQGGSNGHYAKGGEVTAGWGDPNSSGYVANNMVMAHAAGKTFQVNKKMKTRFEGFVNALVGSGYHPQSIGGYRPGVIPGSNQIGNHAYGAAIDIDPFGLGNPFDTGHTSKIGSGFKGDKFMEGLAARFGLGWGGEWISKRDFMHFEAFGAPASPNYASSRYGNIGSKWTGTIGSGPSATGAVSSAYNSAGGGGAFAGGAGSPGVFSDEASALAGILNGGAGNGFQSTSSKTSAQSSSGSASSAAMGMSLGGGGNNSAKIFRLLVSRGFTPQAAAGVIGNIMQESGANPRSVQSGGPGRGIMQWSVGQRWANLQKWAGKRDPWALDTQVGFMLKEMDGAGLTNRLKNMSNTHAATDLFEQVMERAGNPAMGNRYGYADSALAQYGKNGGAKSSHAVGAWNVDTDKDARIHGGEMIIPRKEADTIRDVLLHSAKVGSGGGGGGPRITFSDGAIRVSVSGSMDSSAAKVAGKQIVDAIVADKRIVSVGKP